MNTSSSFLDLLFILLLATLAMLCNSSRLGALDGAPAKAGGGVAGVVNADQVVPIYVAEQGYVFEQQAYDAVEDLPGNARPVPGGCVLLIPVDASVSHPRVIAAWSELSERGWETKLGVQRVAP